jgi:hypothetical protein
MTDNQQPRNCEECGAGIRPWDFTSGRAMLIRNVAYCATCKPGGVPVPPPMPESKGETKWRRARNKQIL